jgi:hypothetical protein
VIPRLYSARELTELWPVSESWLLTHVPSIKVGGRRLFPEAEVKAWLEQAQKQELAEVVEIRRTG